jgi:hypothetical protein
MDDPSFQTDEPEEPELSYDEMEEDFSVLESIMVTDEEPQHKNDPLMVGGCVQTSSEITGTTT